MSTDTKYDFSHIEINIQAREGQADAMIARARDCLMEAGDPNWREYLNDIPDDMDYVDLMVELKDKLNFQFTCDQDLGLPRDLCKVVRY